MAAQKTVLKYEIFVEWRRLTRFYRSSLMALQAEEASATLNAAGAANVSDKQDRSTYTVTVPVHLIALADRHLLHSSILILSCGLVEQHVAQRLRDRHAKDAGFITRLANRLKITGKDAKNFDLLLEALLRRGGVETWVDFVAAEEKIEFAKFDGGRAGLIEVNTLRNALAHGTALVTRRMVNRVTAAGGALRWPVGSLISLEFSDINTYRRRLLAFARLCERPLA